MTSHQTSLIHLLHTKFHTNRSPSPDNLQTILIDIPRSVMSVIIFIGVGLLTSKKANLRLWIMATSVLPPFAGFLGMSLLPNDPAIKWTKWGCYFITVPFVLGLFLAWTLIPSNIAGRTKRTMTSSFTFVGYCVGNMVGSQIFKAQDAPKYTPGTIGCAICFGIQFALILTWRFVLVRRNKQRDAAMAVDGLTVEERAKRGKELGEQDYTDFENPYVSRPGLVRCSLFANVKPTVPVHTLEYLWVGYSPISFRS